MREQFMIDKIFNLKLLTISFLILFNHNILNGVENKIVIKLTTK